MQCRRLVLFRVLTNGGPCNRTADVNRLVSRLDQEKKSKAQMKIVLQDEIRYQKVVLNSGRDLQLAGSLAELKNAFLRMLPACLLIHQPSEDEDAAVSQSKHPRLDSHCEDQMPLTAPPAFTVQREWVAVYFDNQFYVGENNGVHSPSEAPVRYLEQTKSCKDYFRYPKIEDVARTEAQFVFRWNLQVDLVSNGSRVWQVSDTNDICEAYRQLKGST